MSTVTVLLIEDQELIRDLFIGYFERQANFKLIGTPCGGSEAINNFLYKAPSVVIIDLNMAPDEVLELVNKIQTLYSRVAIVVISSTTHYAYARRILKTGAKAFITRNAGGEELLHAIEKAVAGHSYIGKKIRDNIASTMAEPGSENRLQELTHRELQIISYLKEAYSSKEIADELKVSPKTIEGYRHKILKKLKLKNSLALMRYINTQGL